MEQKRREIDLKKIAGALFQGNVALKKRALALIFKESVVEAKHLLEQFVGTETDSTLKSMAVQVMKTLESFESESRGVDTSKLLLLFESSDPSHHLLALRALLNRKSPEIPKLIKDCCQGYLPPESIPLIIEILKNNPSLENLEQLMSFIQNPSESVRSEAFDAIVRVVQCRIFPSIFRTLVDSSQKIKTKAFQFLGRLSRANFLESLGFMLESNDSELSRLAGSLLMPFLGKDLIPLLEKHLSHRDKETALHCKKALMQLAQRGEEKASIIISDLDSLNKSSKEAEEEPIEIPERLSELIKQFPQWLLGEDPGNILKHLPYRPIPRIKAIYNNLREFLNILFINSYFSFGQRDRWIDLACFRAFQKGLNEANTVQLMRSIIPSLPDPDSEQDIFPLVLGKRILDDEQDLFLEQILSFEEVFKLISQNPSESQNFIDPALAGLEGVLRAFLPLLLNRVFLKTKIDDSFRIMNFMTDAPDQADPKALSNFEIMANRPLLVSSNHTKSLNLSPFVGTDKEKLRLSFLGSDESAVSDYLTQIGCLEIYLKSLVDDYVLTEYEGG